MNDSQKLNRFDAEHLKPFFMNPKTNETNNFHFQELQKRRKKENSKNYNGNEKQYLILMWWRIRFSNQTSKSFSCIRNVWVKSVELFMKIECEIWMIDSNPWFFRYIAHDSLINNFDAIIWINMLIDLSERMRKSRPFDK